MSSQDPLSHCLQRLNLEDDQPLHERAIAMERQCSKVPKKLFEAGPNLQYVVAIQLAYERYDWFLPDWALISLLVAIV